MGVNNFIALTLSTIYVPSLARPPLTSSVHNDLTSSPSSFIHNLNTSLITTHTPPDTTPLNISSPSQVTCFQPVYFRHQFDINYSDCQHIIMRQITPPFAPTEDLRWGFPRHNPDIDVHLPKEGDWTHGTCNIFVNNIDTSKVDSFSVDAVAFVAKRIGEQCVTGRGEGLRTGGHAEIGHGLGFYVVVGEVSYEEMV